MGKKLKTYGVVEGGQRMDISHVDSVDFALRKGAGLSIQRKLTDPNAVVLMGLGRGRLSIEPAGQNMFVIRMV